MTCDTLDFGTILGLRMVPSEGVGVLVNPAGAASPNPSGIAPANAIHLQLDRTRNWATPASRHCVIAPAVSGEVNGPLVAPVDRQSSVPKARLRFASRCELKPASGSNARPKGCPIRHGWLATGLLAVTEGKVRAARPEVHWEGYALTVG